VTYTVSATISPAATGTLINTATVTAPAGVTDPTPGNNSATDTDTLTPQANLGITKTDGVTTATPGGSVTYTIVASNAGPTNAPGSTVTDALPGTLTATWTCVGALGGACTASGSGSINDTVNLPAGGSVTYTVSATINPAATGTLSNTATVATAAGVTDPTPGNNSATDSDILAPQADLSITKTDGVTTATPGGSVTYTIVASNAGPSNAPGSNVTDNLPGTLTATWTCVGALGGSCPASGSGNINNTVNLPAGGSVTYTVNATISPSATGTLGNTATVTAPAGVTDPTPGNNSATDTDTLTPQANLGITKTDGLATATPGGTVTYTIVASNAGPSNAPGSTVIDTLPATLTGVTWTCTGTLGGTCTASGSGNINDTVNLPAGGSVTYTVSATLSPSATGTLSNTATVTAPAGVTDPTPANNSATDTDTISAITFVVSGVASPPAGGTVNCASPVATGNTTTCTATANAGFTLTLISGCGGVASATSPYTTGAVTAACTVTATFAQSSFVVAGATSPGGTIICASPVTAGNTTTCTVTPDPGRQIVSISGCGGTPSAISPFTTGPITAPCTVSAVFTAAIIPTLQSVALAILALLLAVGGWLRMRRRY
jgi:uncharacterized repeat protein (TIGR01451 family)